MKRIATIVLLAVAGLAHGQNFNAFVLGLSQQTPTGTEEIPCVVSASMKCTSQAIANLAAQSGDVITTNGVTAIQPAAVTLAKQANYGANSIRGNATNSAATGQDLNPLAAANLMSAVISAYVVTSANITLSGIQTIDGQVLAQGQIVLVVAQSTSSQNGLYVVNSSAWTRAINFPSGYVIAQNCQLSVMVQAGTAKQGHVFRLNTGSGAVTIGTSIQTWVEASLQSATPSVAGAVKITVQGDTASGVGTSINGVGFCLSSADTLGSIGDQGNAAVVGTSGPCIVGTAGGDFAASLNSDAPTGVTGTGCSLSAGATDNAGAIVATGADTCTLSFGVAFPAAPYCTVAGIGATVLPYLNALPVAASAVFKTTAAGTFTYHCH